MININPHNNILNDIVAPSAAWNSYAEEVNDGELLQATCNSGQDTQSWEMVSLQQEINQWHK